MLFVSLSTGRAYSCVRQCLSQCGWWEDMRWVKEDSAVDIGVPRSSVPVVGTPCVSYFLGVVGVWNRGPYHIHVLNGELLHVNGG